MFWCDLCDDYFAVGTKALIKVFRCYVSHSVWEGLRGAEADDNLHPSDSLSNSSSKSFSIL